MQNGGVDEVLDVIDDSGFDHVIAVVLAGQSEGVSV